MKNKALFLDRDGVINQNHGYVIKKERFDFIEGIFELCNLAQNHGFKLIVVTNQSGIGRGFYTEKDLLILNKWMNEEFLKKGIKISKIYYCPHVPKDKCSCRKPKPGMLIKAIKEFNIDPKKSILIGDNKSDIKAGELSKIKYNLLFSSNEHSKNIQFLKEKIFMSNSFFEPTPLYKEFQILDFIEKNTNITQRKISDLINSSVSMVNYYLSRYEKKDYIRRKYLSQKNVQYNITPLGVKRRKFLNFEFVRSSNHVNSLASINIVDFFNGLLLKGFKRIILYGAGEVAKVLLRTINSENININVLGVIDDDIYKINTKIESFNVFTLDRAIKEEHDGILISSYINQNQITKKLKLKKYNSKKILNIFENIYLDKKISNK